MTHPGLPVTWLYLIWAFMILLSLWFLISKAPKNQNTPYLNLIKLPLFKNTISYLTRTPWVLFFLKLVSVSLFVLVIYAGLEGTQIPERNISTVLTWNIWWAGLIISIFFFGSAWCAICLWDALATWIV